MSTRRVFLQETAYGAVTALAGIPRRADAGPVAVGHRGLAGETMSPSDLDSDIGSLYPFVKSQAVAGEFPLSFRQRGIRGPGGLEARSRGGSSSTSSTTRRPPCDPRAETVERVDRGEYVQERVYFNTTPDIRVPAFVLIPKKARLPAPGIVALHDHGGFYVWGKEKLVELTTSTRSSPTSSAQFYAGRSIASDLARAGYVVVVIDMFYWGERRMLLADDPPDWRERPREHHRRSASRRSTAAPARASSSWDGPSTPPGSPGRESCSGTTSAPWTISLTRPEVDPRRIGCVGLSVGGVRSAHLAALDDRIKAAVVVGWMTSFPTQLKRRVTNTIGHTKLVPGLYRYLDYPDVASLAMPTPLLVINGSRDALFEPAGVRASFEKLAACYQKAGVPERLRTRLYDTPHEFNREMQAEAWSWLEKYLSPEVRS